MKCKLIKFKTQFQRALKKVLKDIKNDKDLYFGYQSNIAMAFFDNYYRNKKKSKSRADILQIANDAAKEFLDRWLK